MKLGKSALLEIVAIFQEGMLGDTDVSDRLRELDLDAVHDPAATDDHRLELTAEYVAKYPRSEDWEDID